MAVVAVAVAEAVAEDVTEDVAVINSRPQQLITSSLLPSRWPSRLLPCWLTTRLVLAVVVLAVVVMAAVVAAMAVVVVVASLAPQMASFLASVPVLTMTTCQESSASIVASMAISPTCAPLLARALLACERYPGVMIGRHCLGPQM
jgi:hypothetical protein